MSNIFGSGQGKTISTQAVRANGLQVQASSYGMGLPIVYGRNRLPGTLIWYGDFQAVEHDQQVGKGGGGGQNVSYTYSSSFQLALCEGPITKLGNIWKDSSLVSLSDINGTLGTGTANQAAWSHLGSPENLQYPYTCWVGCVNLLLGGSPTVPNFNWEIYGLLPYNSAGNIWDAEPSAIINDLLTSTTHGLDFQYLGSLTTFQNYCVANSVFLSPVVDQETTMSDVLDNLLKITNSNTAWSDGKLTIIPYSDQSATGNGVTYTPPTTIQKYFTDSDYVKPVQVECKPLADQKNVVRVEWIDPSNNYNTTVAEAKDEADIAASMVRQMETVEAHSITNGTLAQQVAQQILQRSLYIRNTYRFTTTMENVALEAGDVIALTDSVAELDQEPVRITQITEQDNNELEITCEEFPAGVAVGATQSIESAAGFVPNFNGTPDTTQPIVIFRAPQFLVDGDVEIWIGACGSGTNWGGANVLVSFDNTTYSKIGTIRPGCRYGTLTAALADSTSDPDTTNSFSVALEGPGSLSGGTNAEADNLATLMLVDQELVAYSSTTLNGDGTYTLGNGYLRRQCYQTAHASHAVGAPWIRVDDNIFRWQVDPSWVGTTVYIKIQPWNLYGGGLVSESSLTATTYVVGAAEEIPDTPPVPSNFTAVGAANGALLTWENTNPVAAEITSVEYSPDGTTWTVLGQVKGTHYTHAFYGNATHYYRVRALSPKFIWSAYTSTLQVGGGSIDYVSSQSIGTLRQLVSSVTTISNALTNGGAFAQWGTFLVATNPWPSNVEFDVYSSGGVLDVLVAVDSTPNGYIFRFDGRSGYARGQILKVSAGSWTNIGTQKNGTASSAASGWHHVLFRYNNSTGDMYIYVDGVLECVATDTTYSSSSTNLYAGYEVATSIIGPSTFYNGNLDSSQRVSGYLGGLDPRGSVPSNIGDPGFAYTSAAGSNSLVITWNSFPVYRIDGTSITVPGNSTGITITGLTASATYTLYPYVSDGASPAVGFASVSGAVGSPAYCYSGTTPAAAGAVVGYSKIPLTSFQATVASASSGSGGGGDNLGYCLTEEMWLNADTQARDAEVGQWVEVAPDDRFAERPERHHIRAISRSSEPCSRLVTASGAAVCASEATPVTLRDGSSMPFAEMLGRDARVLRDGKMRWERVVALESIGEKPVVRLSLGGRSFFAGESPTAMVATHNYDKP